MKQTKLAAAYKASHATLQKHINSMGGAKMFTHNTHDANMGGITPGMKGQTVTAPKNLNNITTKAMAAGKGGGGKG